MTIIKAASVLVASVLTVGILGIFVMSAASGAPGISLDSSAATSCNGCVSQSVHVSVKSGDIVVTLVALSPQSVYARINGAKYDAGFLGSLTSPGMTFQQRFAYTRNPGSGDGTLAWEEYAIAAVTGTVTITGTVNSTMAAWSMIAYSITGANNTNPFDSSPSLPSSDFNDCNQTDGCSVYYSNNNANDMVLAMIGSQGGPGITPPPGYTMIAQSNPNGWMTSGASYLVLSSSQNHVSSGNWALNPGESAIWFVDAIQASSSFTTSTTSTTSTSSTSTASTSSTTSTNSTSTTSSTSSTTTTTISTTTTSTLTTMTSTCTVTFTMNSTQVLGWQGTC